MNDRIHVAYAISRRGGAQYRARAYIGRDRKPCHSRTIAIEETPQAAVAQAVQYIRDMYLRDNATMPALEIVEHGRVAAVVLDNYAF